MTKDDLLLCLKEDTNTSGPTTQPSVISQAVQTDTPDDVIHRHVRMLVGGDRIDIDKCLSTLNKIYDDRQYSSAQRIAFTVAHMNEEQKIWYEQNKTQINDDWKAFCDQLKQQMSSYKPVGKTSTQADDSTSKKSPT